jgi:hypothetical protein
MRSFMTNCNNIKRLIDEAEQPDLLPFETTHHLNACAPCRRFADERAGLRGLLSGMPRVNAPMNFDAQLKARMTTAKAKPSFTWLSPALYLRFGAASAALVVVVFVAQYNGMFSLEKNIASTDDAMASVATAQPGTSMPPTGKPITQPPGSEIGKPEVVKPVGPSDATLAVIATPSRGNRKVRPVVVRLDEESTPDRVPGLIVRRSGREVELPMLPVSLGAQQQLINRSSRSSVQPIAISF